MWNIRFLRQRPDSQKRIKILQKAVRTLSLSLSLAHLTFTQRSLVIKMKMFTVRRRGNSQQQLFLSVYAELEKWKWWFWHLRTNDLYCKYQTLNNNLLEWRLHVTVVFFLVFFYFPKRNHSFVMKGNPQHQREAMWRGGVIKSYPKYLWNLSP